MDYLNKLYQGVDGIICIYIYFFNSALLCIIFRTIKYKYFGYFPNFNHRLSLFYHSFTSSEPLQTFFNICYRSLGEDGGRPFNDLSLDFCAEKTGPVIFFLI